MIIEKDKFVSINYTLKDENGVQLDSSVGKEPLSYIHGNGYLISGLESQLAGKTAGDKFSCTIQPEDAYGQRDERLVLDVPLSDFESDIGVEVGMQFQVSTPEGPAIVTVIEVNGDTVKIDGNHEMAGKVLNFDIEVLEVRDMTEAEEAQLLFTKGCGGNCGSCGGCGDVEGGKECENKGKDGEGCCKNGGEGEGCCKNK